MQIEPVTEYLLEKVGFHFQIPLFLSYFTKYSLPTSLSHSNCTCAMVKIGVETS